MPFAFFRVPPKLWYKTEMVAHKSSQKRDRPPTMRPPVSKNVQLTPTVLSSERATNASIHKWMHFRRLTFTPFSHPWRIGASPSPTGITGQYSARVRQRVAGGDSYQAECRLQKRVEMRSRSAITARVPWNVNATKKQQGKHPPALFTR